MTRNFVEDVFNLMALVNFHLVYVTIQGVLFTFVGKYLCNKIYQIKLYYENIDYMRCFRGVHFEFIMYWEKGGEDKYFGGRRNGNGCFFC